MKETLPEESIAEWLTRFRATLSSFAEIPDGDWNLAAEGLSHEKIPRGGFFLRAGDSPTRIAFIATGLFRVYFVTEGGDERVMAFREQGRIISAFSPFLEDRKSWYEIQAMEDSDILFAPVGGESLAGAADCWKAVYAKYMEMLFVEKESREREFLSDDAEARYRNFRARYPGLENRVPQYEIASYLGITPVALSRVRKKMSDPRRS